MNRQTASEIENRRIIKIHRKPPLQVLRDTARLLDDLAIEHNSRYYRDYAADLRRVTAIIATDMNKNKAHKPKQMYKYWVKRASEI